MDPSRFEPVLLYAPYIILLLGNLGCIGNFITFTSKSLRQNPCGWYFLLSAIFDFTYLNFGLISKIAIEQFGSTLANKSLVWCRVRVFLTWVLPCFATSYLCLASLDRCLATSRNARCRAFSQIHLAHRISLIPIVLYSLTSSHQFFFYDLRPNCAPLSGPYAYFLSLYSIIWTNLIPQFWMLICGFLTYWNVHQIQQRTMILTRPTRDRTDMNLIKMTLFQVISSGILLNLRTGYYTYTVLSSEMNKDPLRRQWEHLFLQMSSFFFYLNFTKSFFINTLTSSLFRQRFSQRCRSIGRCVTCHYSGIRSHPAD